MNILEQLRDNQDLKNLSKLFTLDELKDLVDIKIRISNLESDIEERIERSKPIPFNVTPKKSPRIAYNSI